MSSWQFDQVWKFEELSRCKVSIDSTVEAQYGGYISRWGGVRFRLEPTEFIQGSSPSLASVSYGLKQLDQVNSQGLTPTWCSLHVGMRPHWTHRRRAAALYWLASGARRPQRSIHVVIPPRG